MIRLVFLGLACSAGIFAFNESVFFQKLNAPIPEWMLEQIEEDLAIHNTDLSRKSIDKLFYEQHDSLKLIRVTVVNGEIHIQKSPSIINHPTPELIIPPLYFLSNLIRLPDMDFVFTSHDGMVSHFPVFCVTKGCVTGLSEEQYIRRNGVIVMPDMFAYDGYEPGKSQVLEGNKIYPWECKLNIAFYRGSDIGVSDLNAWINYPRPRLVCLSTQYPHLIDAKFTSLYAVCHTQFAIDNGFMGNYLSMKDHPRYKYLMNVEAGCANTPRFPLLLHANSVIFKNLTQSILWFYKALKPYEHFIPIAEDLTDLLSQLEWAHAHDDECRKISENANNIAADALTSEAVYLYLYKLLDAYARKQSTYYNYID